MANVETRSITHRPRRAGVRKRHVRVPVTAALISYEWEKDRTEARKDVDPCRLDFRPLSWSPVSRIRGRSRFRGRSSSNLDRLGHAKFIAFMKAPTRLVNPDTSGNAQDSKPQVRRKEFVSCAGEHTEDQKQDANQHPVLGNSSVNTIGYQHRREFACLGRACLLSNPQNRQSFPICA